MEKKRVIFRDKVYDLVAYGTGNRSKWLLIESESRKFYVHEDYCEFV